MVEFRTTDINTPLRPQIKHRDLEPELREHEDLILVRAERYICDSRCAGRRMRDGGGEGGVERRENPDVLVGAQQEALGGRPEEIGDLGGEFRGEGDDACGFEGARGAEGEFGGEEGCDECAVGAGEGLCRCWISGTVSALDWELLDRILHFRDRENRILGSIVPRWC